MSSVLAATVLFLTPCAMPDDQAKSAVAVNEKWLTEMLANMNEMADIYETVKDEASGKVALSKLDTLLGKSKDIDKREKDLPKLSKEEDEQLKTKFADQINKTIDRTLKALKSADEKGGANFRAELKKIQE